MYIRDSKLWNVCERIARFMGWGVCLSGIAKVESAERRVVEGWREHERPLDQCNLRSWIITDVFIMLALVGIAVTCAYGVWLYLLAPVGAWLFAGGDMEVSQWSRAGLTLFFLHMGLFCYVGIQGDDANRGARMYAGWWFTAIKAVFNGIKSLAYKVTPHTAIRAVGGATSDVINGFKEIKSNVCEIYELATPTLMFKRAYRSIRHLYEDIWGSGYLLLVSDKPDAWPTELRNQLIQRVALDLRDEPDRIMDLVKLAAESAGAEQVDTTKPWPVETELKILMGRVEKQILVMNQDQLMEWIEAQGAELADDVFATLWIDNGAFERIQDNPAFITGCAAHVDRVVNYETGEGVRAENNADDLRDLLRQALITCKRPL